METNRLSWIDSLRGYAIFAVLAYHVYQALPGLNPNWTLILDFGSMGVQLFFMVSAFTIFMTLDQARDQGKLSFISFYIRRVFRIMPLFYFALAIGIATLLMESLIGSSNPILGDDNSLFSKAFTTLTFTSAWIPAFCPTLVPGGWSIAVEMWFYLVAPLLFLSLRTINRVLIFVFGSLIFRFLINEGLTHFLPIKPALFHSFIYFWLPNQLPIFSLGILAYFIFKIFNITAVNNGRENSGIINKINNRENRVNPSFYLFFALYLLGSIIKGFKVLFPFHFLFGISFFLIMLFMMNRPRNFLANRIMVHLGTISYSAYISHFFVIKYTHSWFFGWMGNLNLVQEWQFIFFLLWTVLITVIVSEGLYRLIEKPGQRLGKVLIGKLNG